MISSTTSVSLDAGMFHMRTAHFVRIPFDCLYFVALGPGANYLYYIFQRVPPSRRGPGQRDWQSGTLVEGVVPSQVTVQVFRGFDVDPFPEDLPEVSMFPLWARQQ